MNNEISVQGKFTHEDLKEMDALFENNKELPVQIKVLNSSNKELTEISSIIELKEDDFIQQSDYYDAEGIPVPLNTISDRMAKNIKYLDKLNNRMLTDLFFTRLNWDQYSDGRKWTKYIEETIPLDRSYLTNILRGVRIIYEIIVIHKLDEKCGRPHFFDKMIKPVGDIGSSRLALLGSYPEEERINLVLSMLEGNIPAYRDMKNKIREMKSQAQRDNMIELEGIEHTAVKLEGNKLLIGESIQIPLKNVPEKMKAAFHKFLSNYVAKNGLV